MRVALDVTHATLNPTGVGRYPAELAPVLRDRDDVDLIALEEPVARRPGRVPTATRALWRETTFYPLRLAAAARRQGAEVLHCATLSPVLGGGLPLVVTIHDLLPLSMPELFTPAVRGHVALSLRFARRATRIVTNSEWTRREVVGRLGIAPERVVATPFGIADRFSPGAVDRDRLRARYGIDGRYVLCVGTREPRKNLVSAVQAFGRLGAGYEDVELVLVGREGWLDAELDAALERAGGRVRTTGFVDDDELVALYRGAACFAFPSLAEGFGFPPLEAMACETPVVASDRGALGEVLGGAALIVEPRDVDALAAALRRVLADEQIAADLRARGRAHASRFTWERCADATLAVYRDATTAS